MREKKTPGLQLPGKTIKFKDMNRATQAPTKPDIFAAFGPDHLSAALSQLELTPSASDLYLFLHSITPFGRFYCWNEQMNRALICSNLPRRTGKRQGQPMGIRTFQRAMKQLTEKGLAFFNRRGFRLVEVNCRKPQRQAPQQRDLFSWAKTRHFDRDQAPEAASTNDSRRRKDRELSYLKKDQETKTQQNFVCSGENLLKQNPTQSTGETLPVERKILKRSDRKVPPPAHAKLSAAQLEALSELGVPPQRIHRNLVSLLLNHPWSAVQEAIAYVKARQQKGVVINPAGYLVDAIKGRYSVSAQPPAVVPPTRTEEMPDLMRRWIALASQVGVYEASTTIRGERMFFFKGGARSYSFEEALKRHPIERLEQGIAEICWVPDPEPELTAEEAQRIIARLPGHLDPKTDFRLKASWFDDQLRDFGYESVRQLLPHWPPFQDGQVKVVQNPRGFRLDFSKAALG